MIVSDGGLGTARKKYEAMLAKQYRLGVFYFPAGLYSCAQIRLLVRRWSDIKIAVAASRLPFGCKIQQRGALDPAFGGFKRR